MERTNCWQHMKTTTVMKLINGRNKRHCSLVRVQVGIARVVTGIDLVIYILSVIRSDL